MNKTFIIEIIIVSDWEFICCNKRDPGKIAKATDGLSQHEVKGSPSWTPNYYLKAFQQNFVAFLEISMVGNLDFFGNPSSYILLGEGSLMFCWTGPTDPYFR